MLKTDMGLSEHMEQVPCAAFFLRNDSDLTLLHGNVSFYSLLGCTAQEMQYKYGGRLGALMDAQSVRQLKELAQSQVETGNTPTGLALKIRRHGEDAWIYTNFSSMQYGGQPVLCCVSFDVTESERERQSFCSYEGMVRFVVEQTNLEVFWYDLTTKTAQLSMAPVLLAGLDSADTAQYPSFEEAVIDNGLLHPDYEKTFLDTFAAVRQNGIKSACELRVAKNGGYAWFRFTLAVKNTGTQARQYAVGILEDITQQKEASLNYLSETQYYQAMLSEKDAYAHVDITMDKVTRIGGIWNLYNEVIDKITYSALIFEFINKVVHPEDRKHYLELMQRNNFIESFSNGIDQLGCEFRRIVEQNKMVWMQLSVHLMRDPLTHHILALLSLKNIDEKKKQELSLLHNSERDHLTNIFNRKMAEGSIREYLKRVGKEELCAFIILDLDNFKKINDTLGHRAGDQVLMRMADVLGRAFRRYDIVGRFGGDEFIIFLKNIVSEKNVSERLYTLYDMLRQQKPEISCSMGVCMIRGKAPFEQIFQRADAALYAAKQDGKGRYCFYQEQMPARSKEGVSAGTEQPADHAHEPLLLADDFPEEETVSAPFDAFVAEQGDIAYLVDPQTFTLICGNKAFYDRIGVTEDGCIGMKCYEAMHKRTTPCPFCSKANWSTDKFYLWKNFNESLEQEFLIKNKLVKWQGQEVLLALAVDISNNKSIVDSIENGAAESQSLLSGIQRMTEAESLDQAMRGALETIGYFFRASAVQFWVRDEASGKYCCRYDWAKSHKSPAYTENDQYEISAWLLGITWKQPIMIESREAMLCYSYEMFQLMQRNNITNQRWMQLKDGETEFGCVGIDNISSNFQNLSFWDSFSVFISGEMKKRSLMERIFYANLHDDLTKLLNRNYFEKYLEEYSGDSVPSVGVVVANLNNLKEINSNRGFYTGNYYLKQFAAMLRDIFAGNKIFRLNGDEFLVIAVDLERVQLDEKVRMLERRIAANGLFSVAVGYSWDNVENDLALLLEQSTQAMRVNKRRHYDMVPFTSDNERHKMLQELIDALEHKEFEVFLQPKVKIIENQVIGAEALIRYRHKEMGIIPPGKFIGVLEKNNFIRYIDLFVFEEVCKLLEKWKIQGVSLPVISLNFSRLTMLEKDILSSVENIISQYDVSRHNIEIEITESFANMGKSILYQTARAFYEAGFSISLDDFGTKYTNLSILADIDFDMLKLDKSLINAIVKQKSNQIILKNIIFMCRDLNIGVIAEGVETKAQEKILRELECRLGQGYLYGKPVPIAEFEAKYICPMES